MRNLLGTFFFFLSSIASFAQLADGSLFPPGLVLTDINGISHSLDADLNSGKTLFIIVSATWSGPDWVFHNQGIMQELYNSYGPQGTNELRVYFIEGIGSTTVDDLYGIGTNTQGDWITGTPYPIIDDEAAATTLQIGFFPTLYMICPSRRVWHISPSVVNGYWPASQHIANARDCNNTIDAAMVAYTGETSACSTLSPLKVQIRNKGALALTNANISATLNGNQVASTNWTGTLQQFQSTEVSFGSVLLAAQSDLVFTVTPSGTDVAPNDNAITQTIDIAPIATTANIIVKVTTDQYRSESSWRVKKSDNTIVASGGNYGADLASVGTTVQTPVTVTLLASDCYYFEMVDSYGDGICCQYGQGSYQVTDANGLVLLTGGEFTSLDRKAFSFSIYSNGTIISNGLEQTANPAAISFNSSPSGCPSYTYQWYSFNGITSAPTGSSTAGWTLIPGATSSSYDPPVLSQSTSFACFVTPSAGCGTPGWAQGAASFTITSSAGQINSALVQQCSATPVELNFTSAPSGLGNVAYQWYYQSGEVGCPQGSSTFGWQIVSGGNAATASFTPPTAGTYTLACFVNSETGVGLWALGCKLVIQSSFEAQVIIGSNDVVPFTQTPYLVSQITGHTYQWTATGGAIASGQGTNFVNVVWGNTGPYSLQLLESDGVCSDISVFELGVVTGLNASQSEQNAIRVHPNPAYDVVTIETIDFNSGHYCIVDLSGRSLIKGTIQSKKTLVSLYDLPPGVYFLQFDGKPDWHKKIIKQ